MGSKKRMRKVYASGRASQQAQPAITASQPAQPAIAASQRSQPASAASQPAQPASHQTSIRKLFYACPISFGKVTDDATPATQPTGKNTDPPQAAIKVAELISGSSGDVIITQAIILKRLKITSLPDKAVLTNLDFLQGQAHEGTDED